MHHDVKKAQLVTERYWELQGLRGALIGTGYVLGASAAILLPAVSPGVGTDEEIWSLPVALGLAFLVIIPGMAWLDRFYERTFGRLKPTKRARRFGLIIVPALLMPGMVAAPHFGQRGYVSFFIGWTVVGIWIAIRDWPFRTHHLLDVVAGILGAVVVWRVSAEEPEGLGLLWGLFVIGTAAIVTGFRDHQLLAATLRGGSSEAEPGEFKV